MKIDGYLKSIINIFYDSYIKFKIKLGLPEYLKNIDSLKASMQKSNNLNYFNNCYIIPSKIIDKIIKFELNNYALSLIKTHKILSRNENVILLIDSTNINVGVLNRNYLFKIKYIFSYNSPKIYEKHKLYFSYLSFEDYIKQNNCNSRILDVQIMKSKKGDNYGKLLVLKENVINSYYSKFRNYYSSNSYDDKKWKKSRNVQYYKKSFSFNKYHKKNIASTKNLIFKKTNYDNDEIEYDQKENTNPKLKNRIDLNNSFFGKEYIFKKNKIISPKNNNQKTINNNILEKELKKLKDKIKILEEKEKKNKEIIEQKQRKEEDLISKL